MRKPGVIETALTTAIDTVVDTAIQAGTSVKP
jgi:hypothetical protein